MEISRGGRGKAIRCGKVLAVIGLILAGLGLFLSLGIYAVQIGIWAGAELAR
jgi:hypothetical protein